MVHSDSSAMLATLVNNNGGGMADSDLETQRASSDSAAPAAAPEAPLCVTRILRTMEAVNK